jgi:hypothetical protein
VGKSIADGKYGLKSQVWQSNGLGEKATGPRAVFSAIFSFNPTSTEINPTPPVLQAVDRSAE